MQTTAIRTVANSLPENEVILLTLLISKRYIPYTDLRKISGISVELQQIKTKVWLSYHYPIILLQQSYTWIHTAHSYHSRTDNNRKTQESQDKADGKQTLVPQKANTVRLCADDVLTREKLVAYHDSYAKAMEKYGLQRGIRGSEARHTTTAQYYRDLKRQTGELEANVQQLQTEQQQAEQQLDKGNQVGETGSSQDGSESRIRGKDRFSFR